jgi:hypothetical protein
MRHRLNKLSTTLSALSCIALGTASLTAAETTPWSGTTARQLVSLVPADAPFRATLDISAMGVKGGKPWRLLADPETAPALARFRDSGI